MPDVDSEHRLPAQVVREEAGIELREVTRHPEQRAERCEHTAPDQPLADVAENRVAQGQQRMHQEDEDEPVTDPGHEMKHGTRPELLGRAGATAVWSARVRQEQDAVELRPAQGRNADDLVPVPTHGRHVRRDERGEQAVGDPLSRDAGTPRIQSSDTTHGSSSMPRRRSQLVRRIRYCQANRQAGVREGTKPASGFRARL